jgi:hypothetical protein
MLLCVMALFVFLALLLLVLVLVIILHIFSQIVQLPSKFLSFAVLWKMNVFLTQEF